VISLSPRAHSLTACKIISLQPREVNLNGRPNLHKILEFQPLPVYFVGTDLGGS
jgi:hypothetical protein